MGSSDVPDALEILFGFLMKFSTELEIDLVLLHSRAIPVFQFVDV